MDKLFKISLNVIFCIQIFLVFLLFVEDRIKLPLWLAVAGRFHPLILHLPIGFIIFLTIVILFEKKLEKNAADQILSLGLIITSLSASVAALFGFFLSLQNDYGSGALLQHKITGVVLSWFCYLAVLFHRSKKRSIFLGFGSITLVTLLLAGHTGSVLTHGENFLLSPLGGSSNLTLENASVYQFAVQPIFEKKCFSCHNEAKAKGKLIMTSIDKFKQGGENGKPWIEGKPKESRMIKAFYLPLSHDEHMPPDGKPQLTAVEISTIESWIKSGADFEKKLNEFPDGDSLKFMVASFAADQSSAEMESSNSYSFEGVSDEVIEKLNTPFRSVFPLYVNSPALQADFFLKDNFQVKSLEELKAIRDQLVVLNLSKMPITDNELSIVADFKNLEILNLNFTKVGGSGLASLASLKNLRSLSLAGTAVSGKDLESVLKLPNIQQVYVWNTKVSEEEKLAFSKKYKDVDIIGNLFSDESLLKLSRPRLENDGVIRKNELVTLKHNMPGAVIRLTRDGTGPDSIKSDIYDKPFSIAETKVIKAKACKDSWYCSDVVNVTCFKEGIPVGEVELINTPDRQYPGEGAKTLTDFRKGFADVFKEPSWLGYRDQPFSAGFTFDSKTSVSKVVISYGRNIGGFIFPPEEVEVWAGADKEHISKIGQLSVNQPKGYIPPGVEALEIPVKSTESYTFYKVVARPVKKLPQWHDAKGEKAWFFIDEIFFY
jgi:hypothetical protein